jgi:hypothetical protein
VTPDPTPESARLRPRLRAGRRALGRAARGSATALRRTTAWRRPLPAFLIVGAAKAGTTSLHEHLSEHPAVSAPTTKEIHYFDFSYRRGPGWYRAHFRPPKRDGEISGESTPYYLFHPLVPERVARDLPEGRFIAVLRNPIDRAYSQHNHERASGHEDLPFEQAIAAEGERLRGEEERLVADAGYRSFSHQHHSYLARSRYAEQLERWFGYVDRDRFLILSAEDLFEDPQAVVADAQRFLGLEPVPPRDLRARNSRSYAPIAADVRERLRAEFEPHNRRLYELVGRDFGWK